MARTSTRTGELFVILHETADSMAGLPHETWNMTSCFGDGPISAEDLVELVKKEANSDVEYTGSYVPCDDYCWVFFNTKLVWPRHVTVKIFTASSAIAHEELAEAAAAKENRKNGYGW